MVASSSQDNRLKTSDSDERDVDELYEEDAEPTFRIVDELEAPQALMFSTYDLHDLIHRSEIDLSPPYQRDVVWTESKQMKLVDSIYHNYYVPPIIFAVVKEDGFEVRRCVDGKQRLTSIQKFIDGQIPYRDPITNKNHWFLVPENNKTRLQIPQEFKTRFLQKCLTCVEYRNLPPGLERDIFQRVQLGMPLTAAEKLQAISSPWAEWISHLSTLRVTSVTGIVDQINVDLTRGRDFQSVGQFVFCCDGLPEARVPTAQKLEQWLNRMDSPSERFKKNIEQALQKFWVLTSDSKLNAAFTKIKQRVAPVEFVFIGILLYSMKNCTDEERAEAIYNMRTEVRQEFKDIRTNNFVVRYLWEFISRASDKYDTGMFIESMDPPKAPRKSRKRPPPDSDDDSPSYSPTKTPAKNQKTPKQTPRSTRVFR